MYEVLYITRKPMAIVAEIKSSLRYMSQEMASCSSILPAGSQVESRSGTREENRELL